MTASLLDKLSALPQRETGGSTATNRYRYQHHWAIELMVSSDKAGVDFLMFFEHHEDVLLMWPAHEPTAYSLFQVKTYDGKTNGWCWTAVRLCERKKGKKKELLGSPLGKLLETARKLDIQMMERAMFVSNRPFKLTRNGDKSANQHTKLTLEEVTGSCDTKINNSIQTELGIAPKAEERPKLHFEQSGMAVSAHEETLRARLSDYVESLYDSNAMNVGPLLRTLQAEVARRSSIAATGLNGPHDFRTKKSISRTQFREWCAKAQVPKISFTTWWTNADVELSNNQYSILERRSLRIACSQVAVRRAAGREYAALEADEARIRAYLSTRGSLSLRELLDGLQLCVPTTDLHHPNLAKALLLHLIFHDEQELQNPDSGTAAKDT